MNMIETTALTKRYGAHTALDGLDLCVAPGELYGFIGPNGAGKTTTLQILATLLPPTSGTARIAGLDVRSSGRAVRRRIGFMPDFLGLYESLRASEYLEFFAAAYDVPAKERRRVIGNVLALTDLTPKSDALVGELSRGMQQRLSLARVLIHDPKVLLLDEPASGLDPRARVELREILKELSAMGKTIVL
ncbi:MAG TPA: ABC transporter ATP-binding protein, partial [Thermoanaerobaculia bacterium]|nr:ABC transporter ATP-binding protein [Thermoanaerobaculia bacterium]